MAIEHIAVYQIKREGPVAPVIIAERADLHPVSGLLDELYRDLKSSVAMRAGKLFGQFGQESGGGEFANWLREYEEEQLSFLSFTNKSLGHLKQLLENAEVEVNGYWICAYEKLMDGNNLYLMLVGQNQTVYFDGDLNLQVAESIDKSCLQTAIKLDLELWKSGDEGGYLSICKAVGNADLTEVLTRWVGFSDERNTKAETEQFLEAVSTFTGKMDSDQGSDCRNKVVDYCIEQSKRGEPVVIRELAEHIDPAQPEPVVNAFRRGAEGELPNTLYPDRTQLRQFIRISGRNDLLSLSFDAECLGRSVVYNRDTDQLVVNDLPGPLKMKMLAYIRQMETTSDDSGI